MYGNGAISPAATVSFANCIHAPMLESPDILLVVVVVVVVMVRDAGTAESNVI